jgi:hypothetical protein
MAAHSPLRLVFLAALVLPLLPAAALAASAVTSQGVTMRSGPADTAGPVAQLKRGDHVDVRQCDGDFCEILFDGKTGWVSAEYLTRGSAVHGAPTVAKSLPTPAPAQPQVATTAPKPPEPSPAIEPSKVTTMTSKPAPAVAPPKLATVPRKTIVPPTPKPVAEPKVADLPPVPPAPAATSSPKPAAAPKIASTSQALPVPKPKPRPDLPQPPPYWLPAPAAAPPTAVAEVRPQPGPRPKVAIPAAGSRDFALADVPPPPRDIGDDAADWGPPGEVIGRVGVVDGWPRHPRRNLAPPGAGGAHVCFVDPAAGSGFCLREGDRIVAPHRWARRALELRNPGRLNVVVCDIGGACHTYQSSSQLVLGGRSLAEITVAAPGY